MSEWAESFFIVFFLLMYFLHRSKHWLAFRKEISNNETQSTKEIAEENRQEFFRVWAFLILKLELILKPVMSALLLWL